MKICKIFLTILTALLFISCAEEGINPASPDGNTPPEQPSNPLPANDSLNVSLTPTLSWECSDADDDNLTYYVYFGSDTLFLVSSESSDNFYIPDTLLPNTDYYWGIAVLDKYEYYAWSDLWHFKTAP